MQKACQRVAENILNKVNFFAGQKKTSRCESDEWIHLCNIVTRDSSSYEVFWVNDGFYQGNRMKKKKKHVIIDQKELVNNDKIL